MSNLPKEIYVWDLNQKNPGEPVELNLNSDGCRPDASTVEADAQDDEPLRTGVYRLVREVDISIDTTETPVKGAVI